MWSSKPTVERLIMPFNPKFTITPKIKVPHLTQEFRLAAADEGNQGEGRANSKTR